MEMLELPPSIDMLVACGCIDIGCRGQLSFHTYCWLLADPRLSQGLQIFNRDLG